MSHRGKVAAERVSLLGPKSVLNGDFSTTEELVILGQLAGDRVQAPNITIGPAARVTAEIHAGTIRIEGSVIGNVYATVAAVIHASATVQGSVHSPQLTIQDGATINGAINQDTALVATESATRPTRAQQRAARSA